MSVETDNDAAREKEKKRRAPSSYGPSPHSAGFWFAGWLFTIGFAKLIWWKAILGVVAWPYFLGVSFR